mgnify:CR=1 FL=1
MMEEDGFDAAKDYVRVGVKSGGCSGLSYELKFDKEIGENDKVFEDNNVKIAVEKKSFLYLAGTILEFSGGLNGKGRAQKRGLLCSGGPRSGFGPIRP